MKLVAKKSNSQGMSPHGLDWAALDSEVLLAALIGHIDALLVTSSAKLADGMYATLLANYTQARQTVDRLKVEVEKMDLQLQAVRKRIHNG